MLGLTPLDTLDQKLDGSIPISMLQHGKRTGTPDAIASYLLVALSGPARVEEARESAKTLYSLTAQRSPNIISHPRQLSVLKDGVWP
jgi:hypothetical protein